MATLRRSCGAAGRRLPALGAVLLLGVLLIVCCPDLVGSWKAGTGPPPDPLPGALRTLTGYRAHANGVGLQRAQQLPPETAAQATAVLERCRSNPELATYGLQAYIICDAQGLQVSFLAAVPIPPCAMASRRFTVFVNGTVGVAAARGGDAEGPAATGEHLFDLPTVRSVRGTSRSVLTRRSRHSLTHLPFTFAVPLPPTLFDRPDDVLAAAGRGDVRVVANLAIEAVWLAALEEPPANAPYPEDATDPAPDDVAGMAGTALVAVWSHVQVPVRVVPGLQRTWCPYRGGSGGAGDKVAAAVGGRPTLTLCLGPVHAFGRSVPSFWRYVAAYLEYHRQLGVRRVVLPLVMGNMTELEAAYVYAAAEVYSARTAGPDGGAFEVNFVNATDLVGKVDGFYHNQYLVLNDCLRYVKQPAAPTRADAAGPAFVFAGDIDEVLAVEPAQAASTPGSPGAGEPPLARVLRALWASRTAADTARFVIATANDLIAAPHVCTSAGPADTLEAAAARRLRGRQAGESVFSTLAYFQAGFSCLRLDSCADARMKTVSLADWTTFLGVDTSVGGSVGQDPTELGLHKVHVRSLPFQLRRTACSCRAWAHEWLAEPPDAGATRRFASSLLTVPAATTAAAEREVFVAISQRVVGASVSPRPSSAPTIDWEAEDVDQR